MNRIISMLTVLGLVMTVALGCSGGHGRSAEKASNPIEPSISEIPLGDNNTEGVSLLGMWEIEFDMESLTARVEPIREMMLHYNITQWLPAPGIHVNSFDPVTRIADVYVTIANPYTIGGYDVRGILYTNGYGLTLVNADDWTGLFDIPGGLPINPFMAFAKGEPKRYFPAQSSYTEKYMVYFPNPSGPVKYAITASFPGNCTEPYSIYGFSHKPLNEDSYKKADSEVYVLDWQNNTNAVFLYAPDILGSTLLPYTYVGYNTWKAWLSNVREAPGGIYDGVIIARSADSGTTYLYDFVKIKIDKGGKPSNMTDVTPTKLNFHSRDLAVDYDRGFLYVATLYNNVQVFSIENLSMPKWYSQIVSDYRISVIEVERETAYMGSGGLEIFDVKEPAYPFLIKSIPLGPYSCEDVRIFKGYAYVAKGNEGVYIVDVDPPSDAYVVSHVDTAGITYSVDVEGSTMYVADGNNGLLIYSVSDPSNPILIGSVPMTNVRAVDVYGEYAYVASSKLNIVDINPPETAYIVKTVSSNAIALDVVYCNGYVYAADYTKGLTVFDVDPPGSAYVVSNCDLPGLACDVSYFEKKVFVACQDGGFAIFNLFNPAAPTLLSNPSTPGYVVDVKYFDGYCFVANCNGGYQSVDVSPIEDTHVTRVLDNNSEAMGIVLQDKYAYMAMPTTGLQIVDITNPDYASFAGSVYTGGAQDVEVFGSYAYISNNWSPNDIKIIDVSNKWAPVIVKTVPITDGVPYGMCYRDGYLYVACHSGGLQIIDVEPFGSASVVKTVPINGLAWDVVVQGSYAYVVSDGLSIVDISDPLSANVVNYLYIGSQCYGVDVQDGYAYVCNYGAGLRAVDIDPPLNASVISTISCPRGAFNVDVSDSYAYVACYDGGLTIVKLW